MRHRECLKSANLTASFYHFLILCFFFRIRQKPFDPSTLRLSQRSRAHTSRPSRTYGTTVALWNAMTDGENISLQILPNSKFTVPSLESNHNFAVLSASNGFFLHEGEAQVNMISCPSFLLRSGEEPLQG